MKCAYNLLLQIDDFISKNKLYSKKEIQCVSDLLDSLNNIRFFIQRVDEFECKLKKQLQALDDLALSKMEAKNE